MRLTEEERELVLAEAGGAVEQVRAPELRAAYAALVEGAAAGELPDELLGALQTLLEVGLESGRIRRLHTAHGEMAALRLFSRTPRGRALQQAAEAVNEALRALAGQTLEEITVTPAGPGAHTVTLRTDQGRLILRLDRDGPRLQSLEVG